MLTEGLKEGKYSESTLPNGDVCRVYGDGSVECRAPGEKEFTPRAVTPKGEEFPSLKGMGL